MIGGLFIIAFIGSDSIPKLLLMTYLERSVVVIANVSNMFEQDH